SPPGSASARCTSPGCWPAAWPSSATGPGRRRPRVSGDFPRGTHLASRDRERTEETHMGGMDANMDEDQMKKEGKADQMGATIKEKAGDMVDKAKDMINKDR